MEAAPCSIGPEENWSADVRNPRRSDQSRLAASSGQPLIGVIVFDDGEETVHYFCSEDDAESAIADAVNREALDLAGAWSDLSWGEIEAALERIRHESPPSPPITA
jgi:hypothetical protein